ncbi:MAG: tetratricopeptide repeat protein [Cyclobacteriaceae bacterium]|nr:tetratricopeptide repeat protein [Cyclobacteriaceae bacterium]
MKRIAFGLGLLSMVFSLSAQNRIIDSLQQIVALQKHDTIELTALTGITNEYLRLDLQKAKKYAFQTVALAKATNQDRWLSGCYNYLTTIYREAGLPDSSIYYLQLSESLVQKHPANVKMRFNFNQSASLFYKNMGEYKKALPYMQENLTIYTKVDENRAGQFLNLGNLYLSMGDYQKAADAHINSLRLFESLNVPRGQSFCLHSLGNDFLFLKQPATAKKYYEESLALKIKLGDKRGVIISTSGLGDAHKDLKQYKKAEAYYTEALAMARNLKISTEVARILHQSGLLFKRMNELDKARENFEQSMDLSLQLGDSATFKRTRSEKIGLELLEKSKQSTELELLNGLNTFIRTGDRQQQANEYAHLSEYYAANKNFEKAFYYMQKHEALSDSVEGNIVLLQIKELEERYNSDKKEQQIVLLQKDQQLQALQLKQQKTNITLIVIAMISVIVIATLLVNRYRVMNRIKRQAELENMRQNIARDLHDDIGSTLSSINIMSKLAMQQNDNTGHLQKISSYSSRMMETMSDLVWSINPVNDSVEQMLAKMKEFAGEMLEPKNIQYEFAYDNSVNEIRLDVEKRKSLFLIFKEAINNIAKYSEATQVFIRLNYATGMLHMQVQDNGKGFDASVNTTGNGLKNMAARAQAIKGKWTQLTEPGKGTSIAIEIPIT